MLRTNTPITIVPMIKNVIVEYPSRLLSSQLEVLAKSVISAKF